MVRSAVSLLLLAAAMPAQHGSTTRSNPFNTPEDRAEGARLFRAPCAACHGPNGTAGAAGPNLTTGTFKHGNTDEAVFGIISKGIAGTPMPPYSGDARQVWQIVGYVHSLSAGKGGANAKGDPARGAKLFEAHGCARCHAIGVEGATLGPPLSNIGAERSYGALQRALTNPDDEVSADYWMLRARTKNGRDVSGIRLNEDTYSIQYRDQSGLKSVWKEDLAQYEVVGTSPMPSYRDKLKPAELEDLLAFLSSLRRTQ